MDARQILNRLLATFLLLMITCPGFAEGPQPTAIKAPSPHNDNGDCSICHVASADKLRSWFAHGSTKRELVAEPTKLCQKCHGVNFGHGVGLKPTMNRASLPLDAQGKIACAITCHDMHVTTKDAFQQRYHLRYPITELCASCHQK